VKLLRVGSSGNIELKYEFTDTSELLCFDWGFLFAGRSEERSMLEKR
jgi:DUF971 family protein